MSSAIRIGGSITRSSVKQRKKPRVDANCSPGPARMLFVGEDGAGEGVKNPSSLLDLLVTPSKATPAPGSSSCRVTVSD